MLESVIPGVRVFPVRTPTLPPATHTNAWVLGERDVVVVDPASPWPEEQEALANALDGVTVRAIFLTHHHRDHVSGAEDLRARTGAPILAHPQTVGLVPFSVDEAVEALTQAFPGIRPVHNLDEALAVLEEARRTAEENGAQ